MSDTLSLESGILIALGPQPVGLWDRAVGPRLLCNRNLLTKRVCRIFTKPIFSTYW